MIEHERRVTQRGRFGDQSLTEFIRTGEIEAFCSEKQKLLLLCGKKDDILDFCKLSPDLPDLQFIRIDMNRLLEKLAEIRLAWFRYSDSTIHASALSGVSIERTPAFVEAKTAGEISTLSFYIVDTANVAHPVLITSDGAVVLQSTYKGEGRRAPTSHVSQGNAARWPI